MPGNRTACGGRLGVPLSGREDGQEKTSDALVKHRRLLLQFD